MTRICFLIGMLLVVTVSTYAKAQDGKERDESLAEIGARLKQAVADGEMTEEEALEKYKAFVNESKANENASSKDLEELGASLKAAVAAGKMTEEEAIEKYNAAVAEAQTKERAPVDLQELGARLKEAVAAGKMTEEEAIAKYKEAAAMAQQELAQPKDTPPRLSIDERQAAFKEKLGALVEAGKLSREEAIALYLTAFGND